MVDFGWRSFVSFARVRNKEVGAVKYMLLFCGTREAQRAFDAMTPEELRPRLEQVGRWFGEYGSTITESNQLQPPDSATTVHLEGRDEPLVVNGPFLEGNEVIGGDAGIHGGDLHDAVAVGRPGAGGGGGRGRPNASPQRAPRPP